MTYSKSLMSMPAMISLTFFQPPSSSTILLTCLYLTTTTSTLYPLHPSPSTILLRAMATRIIPFSPSSTSHPTTSLPHSSHSGVNTVEYMVTYHSKRNMLHDRLGEWEEVLGWK